jgi:hypothetical protein
MIRARCTSTRINKFAQLVYLPTTTLLVFLYFDHNSVCGFSDMLSSKSPAKYTVIDNPFHNFSILSFTSQCRSFPWVEIIRNVLVPGCKQILNRTSLQANGSLQSSSSVEFETIVFGLHFYLSCL